MDKIKKIYVQNKEIIDYLFFGGCTAVVKFSSYLFFAKLITLDEVVSSGLSWVCAVIFAYLTNKIFVFQSKTKTIKDTIKEMGMFFGARFFSGLLCDIGIFALMVKVLKINDIISTIINQVLVVLLNYVLSKSIIFKKKN